MINSAIALFIAMSLTMLGFAAGYGFIRAVDWLIERYL